MSNEYQGMRWLKCDLQVQTPEDSKHWSDENLRLGEPRRSKTKGVRSEDFIQEKARFFLRRCHELELDVIGITDHNFSEKTDPRDWFLTHLVEQNRRVARDLGRNQIVILPGFEVDIGYHVLCLFPPANKQRQLEACNRNLTKLGLDETERFSSGQPALLRKDGENVSLKKLISLVQGEMGGIVIAAHADQASGMLAESIYREDFKNPELYCVEVTQNPPTKRYLDILEGRDAKWKREGFYPAWIMSSDAKSLKVDPEGKPLPNSLGYRHTWIKMSDPSIESLRQAFLDPESRIKLPENVITDKHPEQLIKHSYIKSIKIENVEFLEEQEVKFSPNKNSFIGGRGSGKSTLQEYLRIALGKGNEANIDEKTKDKIERIKDTLNDNSKLTVCWVSEAGIEDEIVWHKSKWTIQDKKDTAIKTYLRNLPVQFFSQQQLNQLTETKKTESGLRQAERLLELIDAFDKEKLVESNKDETQIKAQLEEAFTQQRQIKELKGSDKTLQDEYTELERQWKARSEIQEYAAKHQQLKTAEAHLQKYEHNLETLKDSMDKALNRFIEKNLDLNDEQHPFYAFFKDLEKQRNNAKRELQDVVKKALNDFESNVDEFKEGLSDWAGLNEQISLADVNFKAACEKLGLSEEDASQLQEAAARKNRKQQQIEENKEKIKSLKERSLNVKDLMTELHELWRYQLEQRKQAAEKANELVRQEKQKFLEVSVNYQHSEKSFNDLWEADTLKPDRRTRLGRNWTEFGKSLHQAFMVQDEETSPWALLDAWLESENPKEGLATIFEGCEDELIEHIKARIKVWEVTKTSRVEDVIDLKLYRSDGFLAGSIADNSLSDGQRNTAALVLLLAQGEGPLVIDQPEDELDSNFVFKELIPMLRRVKPNRQLILSTHNANLPVNGDAELVYAFEAKDGKGTVRACGGLDRSEVTQAILDVMEGSKEAFTSRREKYGF